MTVRCGKKEITHVTAGFTVRWILHFSLFEWILSYEPEGQLIPEKGSLNAGMISSSLRSVL